MSHAATATKTTKGGNNDNNKDDGAALYDYLGTEACQDFAEAGQCMTDVQYMKEHCALTCTKWTQQTLQYKPFLLAEDAFFNLSATLAATNKKLSFDRLEGYVTLIIPLAKMCNTTSTAVSPKQVFQSIEHIKTVYPYSVEILVFPYEHPEADYDLYDQDDNFDCTEFETLVKQKGRDSNIHVMKESDLRRNPVFQLFYFAMNINPYKKDDLDWNTQFYFVVRPNGVNGSYEYGKSLLEIQDTLAVALKDLEPEL
jgi:hypothetical protein